MIEHYFKLAWRQLVKYRLQSLVSIVSLAIGFACFTMAAMWIKYETTYDAFHKDADGIYALLEDKQETVAFLLNQQEIGQWPEVKEFSLYSSMWCGTANGQEVEEWECLVHDSSYLSIFGFEFLEGGYGFLHDEGQVAISDQLAKRLYGDESPIGQELRVETNILSKQRRTVTGVFKSWGEHTNFPYELLGLMPTVLPKNYSFAESCVMRLHPNVNVDTLNARLKDYVLPGILTSDGRKFTVELKAVPVTQLRHSTAQYESSATFKVEHIYWFACAGLLLIVCGLLNYLTMFINRLFIRQREIALRTVFGATGGNLMVQFLTEYGLLLLIAMFFGNYALKLLLKGFLELTELPQDLGFIYSESFLYMSIVIAVSLLISVPPIWYFRRQSLQNSITGVSGSYNLFRRISTGIQIGISIFSIFCVVVMMKQLNTLRYEDIGFKRENRGYQYTNGLITKTEALCAFLKQQPEIDTVFVPDYPIYPIGGWSEATLAVEDFPQLSEPLKYLLMGTTTETARFYEMTLLQGEWPAPYKHSSNSVVINETFARRMGWDNPIGQKIKHDMLIYEVVGVFKDVLNGLPTQRAEPLLLRPQYKHPIFNKEYGSMRVLFSFKPGTFPTVKQKIEGFYKQQGWDYDYDTKTLEGDYEKMLQSENNLQKLLHITTGVCILIALFGVWSMIMLTCEQRRKEIAIRKVFGATVKDILDMFFLEYMALQGVAALVAFPLGYVCMKPWLEQYVVQTEISWWIYVGIFMAVALLVALCIGWRVWKTATARPADEICKG